MFISYNAYVSEGYKFDVAALSAGSLDECLALVNCSEARISLATIVYASMVFILPHCEETRALGSDITFSNCLHGILFHYLMVHFFCFGVENGYFTLLGLSTASSSDKPETQCAAVKRKSMAKIEELSAAAVARGLAVPDLDSYFFQHRDEPLILNGDRLLLGGTQLTGPAPSIESEEQDSQIL